MPERKPLVAANWKMNGSLGDVGLFAAAMGRKLADGCGADVVICPPYVYLAELFKRLAGVLDGEIFLGAQNLSQHEAGAFTGEIAAAMLHDLGCRYVIVGHSERRAYYGESDDLVAAKYRRARAAGLVPIVCVGETLDERAAGDTQTVIERQLNAVIDGVGIAALRDAVIAYEPVWAIGGGVAARPEQIAEVHGFVRLLCARHDPEGAERVTVVYGGSVNAANAAEIVCLADVDGALVGGASLDADEFVRICRLAGGH